ncbi:phage tail-collar fiber domain-containing protein [Bacillus sp. B-jedd]|uniref:phage tail-collar fiber domain-containing protein n=1 Tax=Bacillus sp. B-jedd TaxID=1476857 RepID=UPI000515624A|nr:phage tail protein [Bacillus sp. B-jedd]CEG29787.1 hypothetical protein BN1002_04748 [Bacillus sp. B-jedd]
MGAFGGLVMTNRGRNLQAKAQTGKPLNFTRIAMGDGQLSGSSILDLNSMRSEKKSLEINKLKNLGDGKVAIGAIFSNQTVTTGFYFREIGLFAMDPDIGEILYSYGNSGNNAEYIPARNGDEIIEKNIDLITVIGSAANVTATIDESLVVETQVGAQKKADAAKAEAIGFVKSFGLGDTVQAVERLSIGNDLNNLNATGFYSGTALVNAPDATSFFFVQHFKNSDNVAMQIASRGSADIVYIRRKQTTWSAWVPLATQDWVQSFGIGNKTPTIVSDLNDATTTGVYVFTNTTLNTPSANQYGTVLVTNRTADRISQLAFLISGGQIPKLYIRVFGSAGWGDWAIISDSGAPSWTNLPLQNGATSNPGYPVQYTKIGNEVRLRGMLNGTVAAGTVFGTLPVGYRPGAPYMYLTTHDGTTALSAKIHISASGVMTLLSKTGDTHVTYVNTDFIT